MKCNQCGSENADTATFCSNCGTALQPGVTISTPLGGQNGPVIATNLGPNGPSTSVSIPIKSKKFTIAILATILVLICGGVTAAIFFGGGKTATYACSKEGKIMTSSIAGTFKRNKLNKLEYTLILEDNGSLSGGNSRTSDSGDYSFSVNDDGSYHFSYSATASDGDEWGYYDHDNSSSNSEEMMEILALSLVFANFEQYADDPGVDYYESDRGSITTYSVTIDVDKLSSKTKDSIFDDDDLGLEASPEMFQKSFTSIGYTCKEK